MRLNCVIKMYQTFVVKICTQWSWKCLRQNIIQIHNNVMWDWKYSMKDSLIFSHSHTRMERENIKKYSMKYCQSYETLLWIQTHLIILVASWGLPDWPCICDFAITRSFPLNDRGEPAVSYIWTNLSLRNNRLKYKTVGKLPIIFLRNL